MRHIWPSPLIRPRTMSIIIAKKRALERPAPMDDPKHEPAEYAALRRMSERLRQMTEQFRLLGPKEEPKERRELLRKLRSDLLREKFKQKVKQVAAATAYVIPLCLLWWRFGILQGFIANWRHYIDLLNGALELVAVLLLLSFNCLIVWMICRKVKNPGWEIGWGIIFLCILFNLVMLLAGPPKCEQIGDCTPTP
jgi:hypothetical protein